MLLPEQAQSPLPVLFPGEVPGFPVRTGSSEIEDFKSLDIKASVAPGSSGQPFLTIELEEAGAVMTEVPFARAATSLCASKGCTPWPTNIETTDVKSLSSTLSRTWRSPGTAGGGGKGGASAGGGAVDDEDLE